MQIIPMQSTAKPHLQTLTLSICLVLLAFYRCNTSENSQQTQTDSNAVRVDSVKCNPTTLSAEDSLRYETVMVNPFTLPYDNCFPYHKDYLTSDSLYLYRFRFLACVGNITCVVYHQKGKWYADSYLSRSYKNRGFRSREISTVVIDSFQKRLTAMNYACLPAWLDTFEYKGKVLRDCNNERSNLLAIHYPDKQYYFRWGECSSVFYEDIQHKPEERMRSAVAYLLSNTGFPQPELYLFRGDYPTGDSTWAELDLTHNILIDSVLQFRADSSVRIRFTRGQTKQNIRKNERFLADSIAVEVLLYTGERLFLRPKQRYVD